MKHLIRMAWCSARGHGPLEQRLWGGDRHAMLCLRCGAILYRKGPGGPMPHGMAVRAPDTTTTTQEDL